MDGLEDLPRTRSEKNVPEEKAIDMEEITEEDPEQLKREEQKRRVSRTASSSDGPAPPQQKKRAPFPWPAPSDPEVQKATAESEVGKIETVDEEEDDILRGVYVPEETMQYWDAIPKKMKDLDPEKVDKGIEQEFDRLDQFDYIEMTKSKDAEERVRKGKRRLFVV